MLTPEYAAGLFDGEGCVSLIYAKVRRWKRDPSRHVLGFKMVVTLANTHREILDLLQARFGGDVTWRSARSPSHRPVGAWKVCSTESQRNFLETIAPLAIIKAQQIELGLRFLKTKVGGGKRVAPALWNERISIFGELRLLNRRGLETPPKHEIPALPTEGWNPKNRRYSETELAEMMQHVRDGQKPSQYADHNAYMRAYRKRPEVKARRNERLRIRRAASSVSS